MSVRIINADVVDGLGQLADESVHCVVTSPPYWGLRDYGASGQIGLEPTLAEHIAKLVEVFREVRRVLRKDGTLWLNYGDGYNSNQGSGFDLNKLNKGIDTSTERARSSASPKLKSPLKPKDLLMMPERLAIALQEDGWYVRSRIIWAKPNPMPESVTDRPTKSHEHIWLMSKAPRYYYDAEAIREPQSEGTHERFGKNPAPSTRRKLAEPGSGTKNNSSFDAAMVSMISADGARNARDVWTIATSSFPEAHFATFPPELAERCIKAGCPKDGTVLDPFGGSGTTGLVADRLQRSAILIELNPTYAAMATRRITNDCPLFMEAAE
jgi:DNA modification methylase